MSEECPASASAAAYDHESLNYHLDFQFELLENRHNSSNIINTNLALNQFDNFFSSDIENCLIMLSNNSVAGAADSSLDKAATTAAEANTTQGCLTAAIENTPDITNIFRVLSTFDSSAEANTLMSAQSLTTSSTNVVASTKQEPNSGNLSEEKTFDIELLLREQQKLQDEECKEEEKVLAQLSPVKMDQTTTEEKTVTSITTTTFMFNESHSLLGDESNSSSSVASTLGSLNGSSSGVSKRTASKRKLSVESNVSSVVSVKAETCAPAKKRGRRPVASVEGASAAPKSKYSKESIEDKTLVFFGNKKVEIGTEEYTERRKSNNMAVKKCREKAEREQAEREVKMQGLTDENQKLTDKVASLSKELDVLKGIIITMRADNKLPETIQKMMSSI